MQIDIISDVNCPFCLLGWLQLNRALKGRNADIRWHPYEINPHLTGAPLTIGDNLARKYNRTAEETIARNAELTAAAAEFGVSLDFPIDLPVYNSRKAHEAIMMATILGRGHDYAVAALIGVFTKRLNPSSIDDLANLAVEIGIDGASMARALEEGVYAAEVAERIGDFYQRGVRGVPTFIFAQRICATGAIGVESFKNVLDEAARPPSVS